jgi:capsid protein
MQEITVVPLQASYGGWGRSGYGAANWSPDRGMVYWPTLNGRQEISCYTRTEIARKVHAICANFGLPRRVLGGLTNLIVGSGLRPQAITRDTEWNELAEAAYNSRANSPLTYSVNGRLTGVQMQRLATMTDLKDGDAAIVFSESANGGALRKLYSGLQIRNADTTLDQSKWTDGLFFDSLDRVQAYRFPDAEGPGFTDIPAQYVRFLCRYESPDQARGVSVLAHAVNRIIDVGEIWRFVTQGIKRSQEIGYYLGQTAGEKNQALGIKAAMEGRNTLIIDNADGTKTKVKLAFGSGGEVPTLPPGVDIKTLMDERPHQNSRDFVDESLIRDICAGTNLSADLLWNIYKLGGANVRYVLADAQVFVSTEQQRLVDSWLTQDWIYTIAKEIKAGRLRACQDPQWWKHGWVPPARVTVDFGRDGAIFLRWFQAGLITSERLYALGGQDAREELAKDLDLVAWHKAEMAKRGLTWDDIKNFRGITGAQTPVTAEDLQAQQDLEAAAAAENPEEQQLAA